MLGTPVEAEVSATSSVLYNTDNRNSRRSDVASSSDDDWGLWANRVDARARWNQWQLSLRMDSAWFYTSRSPSEVALRLVELEHGGRLPNGFSPADAELFVQKFFQAGQEQSDRFVNWTYPAKYSLSYTARHFEATLGDFQAQFGRGLVLSVRKEDELLADTSIRGAKAVLRLKQDPLRLRFTGLAGVLNPQRIDYTSGRVLGTTRAVRPGLLGVAEAGMPTAQASAFTPEARPNFAPDAVLGAELEGQSKWLALGLSGSRLQRTCVRENGECSPLALDLVRAARSIDTWGASLGLPDLWGHGAWFVQYAQQRMHDFAPEANVVSVEGHALYSNLTVHSGPVTLGLEGKHYRSFYPLRANIDPGRAREFVPVQYSAVPTTLPVWNDTEFEGFNTCVTGGRIKSDVELAPRYNVYAWLGRYNTWAESVAANSCQTEDANLNRVWDVAQGIAVASQRRSSLADFSLGARFDATERQLQDARNQTTDVFYREVYTRYDVTLALTSEQSLQFQGWHRRRRQTLGGPVEPWFQGTTVTALQWGPRLNLAFGLEYDQNPAFPDLYLNGQVRYELDGPERWLPWITGPSNVALFVGQRQGGLRCVSGVCRVFAPFEGARLDLAMSF